MLGNIISIIDNTVLVKLTIDMASQVNLVNIHVVFEDDNSKIVGEIIHLTYYNDFTWGLTTSGKMEFLYFTFYFFPCFRILSKSR